MEVEGFLGEHGLCARLHSHWAACGNNPNGYSDRFKSPTQSFIYAPKAPGGKPSLFMIYSQYQADFVPKLHIYTDTRWTLGSRPRSPKVAEAWVDEDLLDTGRIEEMELKIGSQSVMPI